MRPTARPYGPGDRRQGEVVEVNPTNGIPLRDLIELELPLRVPGGAAVVRTPGR